MALATFALGLSATVMAAPSVTIDAGTVNGGICEGDPNAAYFKSIPFASPPVNELRFAPPKAYSGKFPNGALNATQPAPACIQFNPQFAESGPTSEDCLYLNVWAPANATATSGFPVRVWMYGGGNLAGGSSNPLYDGCPVASTGAIMVSINYRLGPLGFLSLKNTDFAGNQGIQDMLLGLQWVQDNIKAFGGDPTKVLFHGQSAGAIDSFAMATLEQAPKLFSSAIFESGGGTAAFLPQAVQNMSSSFAQSLNCATTDGSCLQNKSVSDMTTAMGKLAASSGSSSGLVTPTTPSFGPNVDGKVIPVQPADQGVRVPSIFGSNSMEGTLNSFASFFTSPNGPTAVNSSAYDTFLQSFGADAARIKAQYPLSAFNSTPYPALYAMAEVSTASTFRCPARRGLQMAAKNGVPVWTYRFSHHPKCAWIEQIPQRDVALVGATHTAEIPFVFGHTSSLPPPNGTCQMTSDEITISDFMNKAWTTMAAQQKPGDNSVWPAWGDTQKSLGVNIVNGSTSGFVDYTDCQLWDDINNGVTPNATNSPQSSNSTTKLGKSRFKRTAKGGAHLRLHKRRS